MPEVQNHQDLFSPPEICEKAIMAGVAKTNFPLRKTIILSILAGAYIAFGAVFASIVATGMTGDWPYGIMKLLQGLVFSLGLILVVIAGAELFTGNTLLIMALVDRKITLSALLKNWLVVYLGNFVGSLGIALLIILGKEYAASDGQLGSVMLTIANGKIHYSFLQALALGILCNILVCLAVWLAYSGRSTSDKILAIIGPISLFIAAGFEHSVANMYIIPLGLLIKSFDPTFVSSVSIDLSGLTWNSFFISNLLPVTLGNILGGGFFVGLLYLLAYRKTNQKS